MRTFSLGISMPMSPLATIMPSLAAMISARFLMPCWFSIFGMIQMSLPFSPSTLLISLTPSAFLMKLAKTMSTPCSTPNCRSCLRGEEEEKREEKREKREEKRKEEKREEEKREEEKREEEEEEKEEE